MTSVVLVAVPDALPSCLGSWEDLFAYAGRLSRRRGGPDLFTVERWTPGTPPPHRPSVVLLPARILEGVAAPSDPTVPRLLSHWASEGTVVGAVCAGVFLAAEAGLLDGCKATTHWSLAEEFHRRFPRVHLDANALVVEDRERIIGGGMTAYFDVGLRLIRRYGGEEVARDCAAVFVLDPDRRFQSPFSPAGFGPVESDPLLARAVEWAMDFGVAQWAAAVVVEKRTFERRAQAAWGFGPAERLRRLRLDRARLLVSGGALSWDQVTDRCGYRDPAAFRRLFLARFGQTPGEYHRRFGSS